MRDWNLRESYSDNWDQLPSAFLSLLQETELMTKQESGEEEHCVNESVFQEYITGARFVCLLVGFKTH